MGIVRAYCHYCRYWHCLAVIGTVGTLVTLTLLWSRVGGAGWSLWPVMSLILGIRHPPWPGAARVKGRPEQG